MIVFEGVSYNSVNEMSDEVFLRYLMFVLS